MSESIMSFKEWEVLCEALGTGKQCLLFRKGGIHEGREGFSFAHDRFVLFPTHFHGQGEMVREMQWQAREEWQVGEAVVLKYFIDIVWAKTITDWNKVQALNPFHLYQEALLKERFDWEGKGMSAGSIHVALARVKRLAVPLELIYEKQYGGCRSWVKLPIQDQAIMGDAVVPDAVFQALQESVESIIF